MKIYVVCDLEGVAGVVDHPQQCQWDVARGWYAPYLAQARRLATLELNALVEGALEGGATEVVAWDGHGNFPGGLDVEIVHPACKVVLGAGDGGPAGLDESFAGLFQLGLHAMAGAPRAVLAHSFDGSIAGYWVDDLRVGEIWMNLYTAGLSHVPCVFLSGDRAAADEVQALVPEVEVAVVKEGLADAAGALSVSPALSLSPRRPGPSSGRRHDAPWTRSDRWPRFVPSRPSGSAPSSRRNVSPRGASDGRTRADWTRARSRSNGPTSRGRCSEGPRRMTTCPSRSSRRCDLPHAPAPRVERAP